MEVITTAPTTSELQWTLNSFARTCHSQFATSCRISGFAYAALACFGIEFTTLFLGVSLFIQPMMTLNIVAHFCGLILVILFYVDVGAIVIVLLRGI